MASSPKSSKSSNIGPSGDSGSSYAIAEVNNSGSEAHCFTMFPKFPPEIRNRVWKLACFEQRNVDVWIANIAAEDRSALGKALCEYREWAYQSNAPIPSVLHACRESRSIGLKHYSLEFGTQFNISFRGTTISVSIPPRIFVNWECDIVFPLGFLSVLPSPLEDFARRATQLRYVALTIRHSLFYDMIFGDRNPEQIILYLEEPGKEKGLGCSYDDRPLAYNIHAREKISGDTEEHIRAAMKQLPSANSFMGSTCAIKYMLDTLHARGKHPDVIVAAVDFVEV